MKNSKIEWTDHTFNPWEGCTKVSPGCAHCYAEARDLRFTGGKHWGKGAPRRRTSAANWKQPLRWNRDAAGEGKETLECPSCEAPWKDCDCGFAQRRPRVFCASLADWLDDEVPIEWLADLLDMIRRTPNLDWLLLTKRPENWDKRIYEVRIAALKEDSARADNLYAFTDSWMIGRPPANVWIGTTVEDQQRADVRIPHLLRIPAKVRFLSCEPLLGPVNIGSAVYGANRLAMDEGWGIHWVICGGESGKDARPFVVEWADDILRQCASAGVSFFMKQMGQNPITSNANVLDWPEDTIFRDDLLDPAWAAGASVELKDKKGGDLAEFPEELRIRQFPEVSP